MKIGKELIKVFVGMFILVAFIQFLRTDSILNTDPVKNVITNEYDAIKASKLAEDEYREIPEIRYLVVYDNEGDRLDNVSITLDYLDVNYDTVKSSEKLNTYDNYCTIILLEHNLENLLDVEKIIDYVFAGGKLIYLIDTSVSNNDTLANYSEVLGIKELGENQDTNSIFFNTEILSGVTGELNLSGPSDDDFKEFRYIDLSVSDDCVVHMESIQGQPMIWNKKHNKGNIMVLNLGNFYEKEFRGLLTGSISILEEIFIYPIINAQVVFLDDFPADYNATPEILEENYGRNTERFILDMWWPDMVKLMKKYDLIYTGAYIETYNDVVSGPFENNELILSTTKQLTADLLKYHGEIAFHGYNHQSLIYTEGYAKPYGYKAWKSSDEVVEAINTTTTYFERIYPNYEFLAYVPPSNLIEKAAIPALLEAIPTLKSISGIYEGETANTNGRSYDEVLTQDFGVDERYGVSLPRVTSGAFYSEDTRYSLAAALTTNGIVNHFIHPDDIQDPYRSLGLLWDDLYRENDKLFGKINEYYGWLDKTKATVAAEKVIQYENIDLMYSVEAEEIKILVDNYLNDVSLILTTDKVLTGAENCEYKKIDSFRYLVTMKGNHGIIGTEK